jgi:hypothetical protein
MNASPGPLGPASRLGRHYADAPAGALLTGLVVRGFTPQALRLTRYFSLGEALRARRVRHLKLLG